MKIPYPAFRVQREIKQMLLPNEAEDESAIRLESLQASLRRGRNSDGVEGVKDFLKKFLLFIGLQWSS